MVNTPIATPVAFPVPPASLLQALRASPLCASLDANAVGLLAAAFDLVAVPADSVVMREGETSRELYVVVDGEAEVLRHDIRVGNVRTGQHFGELALISETPRAATVRTVTPVTLGRLSFDAYTRLAERQPVVAQRLLQGMVTGLGAQLAHMTDSVGALLRERSLPRRTTVKVICRGDVCTLRVGSRLREVLPETVDGHPVVAALVENKAVSLNMPVSADCHVEPLTTAHWEGERIWQASVDLLFLEAVHRVNASLRVSLADTAGPARRIHTDGNTWLDAAVMTRVEETMRELVTADAPLLEELWTVEEAHEYFTRTGSHAAALLETYRGAAVSLVSYGLHYALQVDPLVPRAGLLGGFRVVEDQHGWLLVYRDADTVHALQVSGWQGTVAPRTQSAWLRKLGIHSVGELNRACISGSVSELIRVVEGFQEKNLGRIADEISSRSRDVRLICIAGPSSSGKTTFIKRLRTQLQVNGFTPVGLSMDDYYVDRERTPRDAAGEYDYEALEALDLPLLDADLQSLMRGEEVRTARYDFHTGKSTPRGGATLKLGARDLLLMEGIHGLNPRIVAGLDPQSVFRVFVCPRTQLMYDALSRVHTSDVRLLRRIVRDRHARGINAAQSIERWPSVRRGERLHIFPFQQHGDAVFDTSLIYEISVLKVYAQRYLHEVPRNHPSSTTAFRLLRILDDFVAIYPDHVPPTSFLREFIGGSGFEY